MDAGLQAWWPGGQVARWPGGESKRERVIRVNGH